MGALVFAHEGDLVGVSTGCTLVGLLVEPYIGDWVRGNTGPCAHSLEEDFSFRLMLPRCDSILAKDSAAKRKRNCNITPMFILSDHRIDLDCQLGIVYLSIKVSTE